MYGYLKNRGSVQILSYEGNGFFLVLTNKDQRMKVHRDRIIFTKGRK